MYEVNFDDKKKINICTDITFKNGFHKMLFIIDNKDLICYYSDDHEIVIKIISYEGNGVINYIQNLTLTSEKNIEMLFDLDIIMVSENKLILVIRYSHGKNIEIYVINFVDDYENSIINYYNLKIYVQKLFIKNEFSIIFKYKDLLGLQIENMKGQYGFFLLGYFNSTDPKQILNLKKDGLNYNINLNDYLNLQSNIFG